MEVIDLNFGRRGSLQAECKTTYSLPFPAARADLVGELIGRGGKSASAFESQADLILKSQIPI